MFFRFFMQLSYAGALLFFAGCTLFSAYDPNQDPEHSAIPSYPEAVEYAATDLAWQAREDLQPDRIHQEVRSRERSIELTVFELLTPWPEIQSRLMQFQARSTLERALELWKNHRMRNQLLEQLPPRNAIATTAWKNRHQSDRTWAAIQIRRYWKLAWDEEIPDSVQLCWNRPELKTSEEFLSLPRLRKQLRQTFLPHEDRFLLAIMEQDFQLVPMGKDFPQQKFFLLPSALAEHRAMHPEFDWQSAALFGALLGMEQNLVTAWEDYQQSVRVLSASIPPDAANLDPEIALPHLDAQETRNLAWLKLFFLTGGEPEEPSDPIRYDSPANADARTLALAWVIHYMTENRQTSEVHANLP